MARLPPKLQVINPTAYSQDEFQGSFVRLGRVSSGPPKFTSNPDGTIQGAGAAGFSFYGNVFVDPPDINGWVGVYVPSLHVEIPSGAIDGTNMTFRLLCNPIGTLAVFLRGQLQPPGSVLSYIPAGQMITFNNSSVFEGPQPGDPLYVIYQA